MLIYDIKWQVYTAGPTYKSYNGCRTELFLFGCKKALEGNPCIGCFNSQIWDSSVSKKSYTPLEVASNINRFALNRYITIGGGEPTDQFEELIELCSYLKEYGFHIIVYTWRSLVNEIVLDINNKRELFCKLIDTVDIIIDGEYKEDHRLYDENANDGLLNSIGSGNQIIWHKDYQYLHGCRMDDLKSFELDKNNDPIFHLKENSLPIELNIGEYYK